LNDNWVNAIFLGAFSALHSRFFYFFLKKNKKELHSGRGADCISIKKLGFKTNSYFQKKLQILFLVRYFKTGLNSLNKAVNNSSALAKVNGIFLEKSGLKPALIDQ